MLEEASYACTTAPLGTVWTRNSLSKTQYVKGDTAAFAKVVTQVRNVEDTDLRPTGDNAILRCGLANVLQESWKRHLPKTPILCVASSSYSNWIGIKILKVAKTITLNYFKRIWMHGVMVS